MVLDFEIWPFQNRHLEPKGPVQVNGKSDKKCTFFTKFALRKKNRLHNFFSIYIYMFKSRKTQNIPKNRNFCTVARYRFIKAKQGNSVSANTFCDRCVHGRKMLSRERLLSVRSV